MKKIVKSIMLVSLLCLPIISTFMTADEGCASEFHGQCVHYSMLDLDVCHSYKEGPDNC